MQLRFNYPLREARSQYEAWGAIAKVEQLEFRYPWLGYGLEVTASGSIRSNDDLSSPKNSVLLQFLDTARSLEIDLTSCYLNFLKTQKVLTIGYPDFDRLSEGSRRDRGLIAQAVRGITPVERIRLYSSKLAHESFWVVDYATVLLQAPEE